MAEQNVAFSVEGIDNDNSAELIKNSITMLNGVVAVIIDINAKRVVVEYDEERLSADIIKGTIEDAGFEVK
ncbi:MAG: heavy-metal-associated domain-containing protein [Clostridiaceae bacterium]|jgi:copper chaperone|nr:heavy-metal-associated domain-containing protein [Clostridiaceae bacterium]